MSSAVHIHHVRTERRTRGGLGVECLSHQDTLRTYAIGWVVEVLLNFVTFLEDGVKLNGNDFFTYCVRFSFFSARIILL